MPIDGTWYNELNSTMVIRVNAGSVTGTYTTAVSGAGCAKGDFDIAGRADTDQNGLANLGFVVSWENGQSRCESVTAWSGEYRTLANGEEQIKTTWLLTLETDQMDDWKSTLIGQDVFTRIAPSPASVQLSKMLKRHSHPT